MRLATLASTVGDTMVGFSLRMDGRVEWTEGVRWMEGWGGGWVNSRADG